MDNIQLLSQGEWLKALLNMFLNVAICLFAVWMGIISGKQF
jgi:CrcB protein